MKVLRLLNINEKYLDNILEIRIRIDSKIIVRILENNIVKEKFISEEGLLIDDNKFVKIINEEFLENIVNTLLEYSIDNYKNEISNGFITLNDGSRIGISGEVVVKDDKVIAFKNITSINIRLSRSIKGCSNDVIKYIIKNENEIYNTLIVSAPMCGKTTLIRDIAENLSNGIDRIENENTKFKIRPLNVGIVDERFEIYKKDNKKTINRIDVISGINKILGSEFLIRSMNPDVIVLDEIGLKDDYEMIMKMMLSGVSFIATMHGNKIEDINMKLKNYKYLFKKIIILNKNQNIEKNNFFNFEVIENV